jgi:hypothetical protein
MYSRLTKNAVSPIRLCPVVLTKYLVGFRWSHSSCAAA